MTVPGKLETADIIEAINAVRKGEKESYAVITDAEILTLLPLMGSAISSLEISESMATEPFVKLHLKTLMDGIIKINTSIQTQLVRNAQFKTSKATA